jgi:S-adenosylmethionine decarboxylase
MKATGDHLLMNGSELDAELLDDADRCAALLADTARAAGAEVVGSVRHHFAPQGVSVVLLLAESHISIHTFPEHGAAFVDIFTCGSCAPELGGQHLAEAMGGRWTVQQLRRAV